MSSGKYGDGIYENTMFKTLVKYMAEKRHRKTPCEVLG